MVVNFDKRQEHIAITHATKKV
uniref:Uncharacterized protein n=1 Tax=Arundo donax TaxID=35708 RepID=A0A0A9AD68_ARUDO